MAQSIKLGSDTFLHISGIDGLVAAQLPSNADWDTYQGEHYNKVYYVGDSTTMSHAYSSWGWLIVLSWGTIHTQIFMAFGGTRVAIRGKSGSSWNAWTQIY